MPKSNLTPSEAMYGEFQRAFEFFNERLFSMRLPHVLITLKCKPRSLGHFAHGRFAGIADAKERASEIAMNPLHFSVRSLRDTLSTLVHEMVHLRQQVEKKAPRAGYHDKVFAQMMLEIGLHPSDTGAPGGAMVGQKMSHYIVEGGPFDLACAELLSMGFSLSWTDAGAYDAKKIRPKQDRAKYTCPACEANAWAKPGTNLICGDCDVEMPRATD
jgi:hypothetical protein